MMDSTLLLGIIQGLTEFLPVSSSGHLALAQIFLGTELPPLSYDLVLHVATTLATIVFFFTDIMKYLCEWISGLFKSGSRETTGWRVGWAVIAGTFVTGAMGIAMKSFAEAAGQNSLMVSTGLIFTGSVLLASHLIKPGTSRICIKHGALVGIAQGIAVLPGISRSGSTIIAALSMGVSKEEAFRFSFLLSIPAILGATLLQAIEVGGWDAFISSLPAGWYMGAGLSFVTGLISLVLLKKIVISSKWWIFGVYCLVLGVSVFGYTFLGGWS